jgi:hypothetical protein
VILRRKIAVCHLKRNNFIRFVCHDIKFIFFGCACFELRVVLENPPFVIEQEGRCIPIPFFDFYVMRCDCFAGEEIYELDFAYLFVFVEKNRPGNQI